jgi:integrase
MIPAIVTHGLQSVTGLRSGRTTAPDRKPIGPVNDATVDATLPHLPQVVADMVRLQRLTGMRPGEVCIMRPGDLDRSGEVWTYTPGSHKTEHHDRQRVVFLGPQAQAILLPYLLRAAEAYCFSPAESEAHRNAERREKRKTKLWPSHQRRGRKPSRRRPPKERYDRASYTRAIARGCDLAFPAPEKLSGEELKRWRRAHRWHPNQLRHTAATKVRKMFGIEAAQVTLGHSEANVTQIYAERDYSLAARVAKEVG